MKVDAKIEKKEMCRALAPAPPMMTNMQGSNAKVF